MREAGAYGRLDRLLHTFAFRGVGLQKVLADLEDQMFAKELARAEVDRPVFITSLPRAGTTLLLEVVSTLPGFATHTYRRMPFVLCPLLWERVSKGFRKEAGARERAHGDGVAVGYDSPEAFEEVVWRAFWPEKYKADRIEPWSAADRDPEFVDFLGRHLAKVVHLGTEAGVASPRYASKNNANIARLDLLAELYPEGRFLVPFRDPFQQAASLLRQHRRFLAIHAEDDFARRYMEGIGHFEFGRALRPIDFQGWLDHGAPDPMTLDFWLTYWCTAFETVLEAPRVYLIDYDRLCHEPVPLLETLADRLQVRSDLLIRQAPRFRAPRTHETRGGAAAPLRERATDLHRRLQAVAPERFGSRRSL